MQNLPFHASSHVSLNNYTFSQYQSIHPLYCCFTSQGSKAAKAASKDLADEDVDATGTACGADADSKAAADAKETSRARATSGAAAKVCLCVCYYCWVCVVGGGCSGNG